MKPGGGGGGGHKLNVDIREPASQPDKRADGVSCSITSTPGTSARFLQVTRQKENQKKKKPTEAIFPNKIKKLLMPSVFFIVSHMLTHTCAHNYTPLQTI